MIGFRHQPLESLAGLSATDREADHDTRRAGGRFERLIATGWGISRL